MNVTASILYYLTIKNPEVQSPEDSRLPSNKPHPFRPKKLQPWEDFNMSTFKEIYGKKLIQEAQKEGRAFHIPPIYNHERIVHDEETTKYLLGQWTVFLTKAALGVVQDELHPSIWSAETRQRKEPDIIPNKDKTLIHDFGTISLCRTCQEEDIRSYWKTRERFPKEVKPYPKFTGGKVLQRLNGGYWDMTVKSKGEELPIRQAYTYCIETGCRYGCILSAHEAFIFRIKPLQPRPDGLEENQEQSRKAMLTELKLRGLMEYAIVPWKNHRTGDVEGFNELTVNFSLWVLHILAGNSHELAWDYPRLVEETLVQQPCRASAAHEIRTPEPQQVNVVLDTPRTEATGTPSRKRAREVDDLGDPAFSFSESLFADKASDYPNYLDDNSVTGSESVDTSIGGRDLLADLDADPHSRETLRRSMRQRQRTQTQTPVERKRSRRGTQIQS